MVATSVAACRSTGPSHTGPRDLLHARAPFLTIGNVVRHAFGRGSVVAATAGPPG